MKKNSSLKNGLLHSVIIFFLLYGISYGAMPDGTAWKTIETKYAVINYQSLDDLAKFNKKVEYGPDNGGFHLLFLGMGEEKLLDTVSKKIDALYERTQEILDMQRRLKKVTINIYHDQEELHETYSKIYNEPCRIRAWYIFDKNTVYINVDDLHEGMLAHEIAHSIIDHYLLMSPPAASAEILARYVDSHLHDSTTKLKNNTHAASFSEE